ncbi:NifB/NifX family molybdenum-iron cluster-binding protein [Orenia marismortui]|uniref:Putative Fe-Mo cluster-binding NifX family protein n=1 Tax=Orenia marismortui TaxID=46469 RepID=A0A4R8H8Z2_9FIRM|nr:NifB/NifX family molybdenum-iron cluster-binding protein [Orenia marismortui]TDX51401.1 putative Fe-Mo cluster-binding NifX family protein [Orenia marismortui]
MKILAIPTEGDQVSAHFGRCSQFTIVKSEGGEIKAKEKIDNPGHEPGFLPRFLKQEHNVDVILAGGMGRRAKDIFDANNIEVVSGASGLIDDVINLYLKDSLDTEEDICEHDHDDHDCDH